MRNHILATGILMAATNCWADEAVYVSSAPIIDGQSSESIWQGGPWYQIDQHILGEVPTKEDFSGRYTLRWDQDYLYLLAEIQDDRLVDSHADPRQNYWNDDCLEIFIDEDASGGNHQFNYNAFAYHIALDNQAVDIGPNLSANSSNKGQVVLLNSHIQSRWQRSADAPNKIIWEVAIRVFDDSYSTTKDSTAVKLKAGKRMGFMLAYCDSDGNGGREHFMGSHPIEPRNGDKNLGYIDASVFDQLLLIKND